MLQRKDVEDGTHVKAGDLVRTTGDSVHGA
jgi:hypothetical protein